VTLGTLTLRLHSDVVASLWATLGEVVTQHQARVARRAS
jgi:hypothetical protein